MNPDYELIREALVAMASRNASDREFKEYLRTQGFESVDAFADAYDEFRAQPPDPGYVPPAYGVGFPATTRQTTPEQERQEGRWVLQPVTANFGDEIEARLTGQPVEQIREEMQQLPTGNQWVAQGIGFLPSMFVGGGLAGKLIPKTAGGIRTGLTSVGLAGSEAGTYAAGAAERPEDRFGAFVRAAPLGAAFATPLLAAGAFANRMAAQNALRSGRLTAEEVFLDQLGVTPEMLRRIPAALPGETVAERLGTRVGGKMLRDAARGLEDVADIRAAEARLQGRIDAIPGRVVEENTALTPGLRPFERVSDANALYTTPMPATPLSQRSGALQDFVITDQPVLDALQAVKNTKGGQTLITKHSVDMRRPTMRQLMDLEQDLRSGQGVVPHDLRVASRDLKTAMRNNVSEYRHIQTIRGRAGVTQALDEAADLDPGAMFTRLKSQSMRQDVARTFGEDIAADYYNLMNALQTRHDVARRGLQGAEAAAGRLLNQAVEDIGGNFTNVATAIAYSMNKMYGATGRTLIQGQLSGTQMGRMLARKVVELMDEMPVEQAISRLESAGTMMERMRRDALARTGVLAYLGARGGAGLLNQ